MYFEMIKDLLIKTFGFDIGIHIYCMTGILMTRTQGHGFLKRIPEFLLVDMLDETPVVICTQSGCERPFYVQRRYNRNVLLCDMHRECV